MEERDATESWDPISDGSLDEEAPPDSEGEEQEELAEELEEP